MAGQVILFAHQKGGCGKTTLSAHLAVAWQQAGRAVALMDCDPQRSLSAWHDMRARHGTSGPPFTLEASDPWVVRAGARRLRDRHDFVLVDSPPKDDIGTQAAIRTADLVVIPAQPTPMDLWSTYTEIERTNRIGTPAMVVLTRIPARSKLCDTMRATFARENIPVAEAGIGNRTAFAASMLDGRGVSEYPGAARAAAEIEALRDEIEHRLTGRDAAAA